MTDDQVDPFHLAARFGTRIVPVEGLEEECLYVDRYDIALVRTGMPQERRLAAAAWILEAALAQRASA